MLHKFFVYLFLVSLLVSCGQRNINSSQLSLNGVWEMGYDRHYTDTVKVPGPAFDLSKMVDSTLWYRKKITMPEGNWNKAYLKLNGARFNPTVYVEGKLVSEQEGGMAPTFHELLSEQVKPGDTVLLEIELQPLTRVPKTNASYIPEADHWRSSVAAYLWDDVFLHWYKDAKIVKVVPFTDFNNDKLNLKCQIEKPGESEKILTVNLLDKDNHIVVSNETTTVSSEIFIPLDFMGKVKSWSPESPALYKLQVILKDNDGSVCDRQLLNYAKKLFIVQDKKFYLNGNPYNVRAGTVVWHRFVRDPEGRALGWNTDWFLKNVIMPLKDRGANTIRISLGNPPERLLQLCDEYGLLVQYEWIFFHGLPAEQASLEIQWGHWLDMAVRHPSVSVVHPYNETADSELKTAWNVLNKLIPQYPEFVLEDRDVIHVHKYWWSLFENLGLYYDSFDQFPKAIMVDEFGGNYLDGNYEPGGYPMLRQCFVRFMGKNNTAAERKKLQTQANSRVAEYWRRIGAAGFSPFCILGSWEDGNHWYEGPLKDGKLKPVWDALTVAYSPATVSLDIWDRNFSPGDIISLPVHLINDEPDKRELYFTVSLKKANELISQKEFKETVDRLESRVNNVEIILPNQPGNYTLEAELLNPPEQIKHPVVSAWDIRIIQIEVPESVAKASVFIPEEEKELLQFAAQYRLKTNSNMDSVKVIMAGSHFWKKISSGDESFKKALEEKIDQGISVVLLDCNEKYLGANYPQGRITLNFLQSQPRLEEVYSHTFPLFKGVLVTMKRTAEGESHIHCPEGDSSLWQNLHKDSNLLWNGYRGGLVAPSEEISLSGLKQQAYLAKWKARNADENKIRKGPYYAYELQGFFKFSSFPEDETVLKQIRRELNFLVEDAPALAGAFNPKASIISYDLHAGYQASRKGQATSLTPLAIAGKDLVRVPVSEIQFEEGQGKLILSQLLTEGRLAGENKRTKPWGVINDPGARQVVLNMLATAIKK